MGMCSNVKKSQKNEIENSVKQEKPPQEEKKLFESQPIFEEEFKDMEEWEGEGVKRIKSYKCDLIIDNLNSLREKFWSKKISQSEIWKAIKQACTVDHIRSELILKKYDLNTINGRINELVDLKKRIYKIPNYCINDPFFEKKVLSIDESREFKIISISICDVYDSKKTNINISDNIKIKDIKLQYAEHNKIDLEKIKLRLLFGGSELKDDNFLYQYKLDDGYIVQILKINKI